MRATTQGARAVSDGPGPKFILQACGLFPSRLELIKVFTNISVLEAKVDVLAEEVGNLCTVVGRKQAGAQVGSFDGVGFGQHKPLARFESVHGHGQSESE
jgi:hypothetical protein